MAIHVLAWILTLVCIGGGLALVFFFALSFGNDKTYQFMVAMITSFLGSMLITYPIYVSPKESVQASSV